MHLSPYPDEELIVTAGSHKNSHNQGLFSKQEVAED